MCTLQKSEGSLVSVSAAKEIDIFHARHAETPKFTTLSRSPNLKRSLLRFLIVSGAPVAVHAPRDQGVRVPFLSESGSIVFQVSRGRGSTGERPGLSLDLLDFAWPAALALKVQDLARAPVQGPGPGLGFKFGTDSLKFLASRGRRP